MSHSAQAKAQYNLNKLQKRLRRLTGQAVMDFNMIEEGDRIMVCLSGGKDSYTMLDMLKHLKRVAPIKFDLFVDEVFVFTPKGDLKVLSGGSTVLDFAYSIHTEVGMKTRGARVNDILVPLSKVLKSGDQIEIITSENIKPTANWLDFVQTSRARSKIKSSF